MAFDTSDNDLVVVAFNFHKATLVLHAFLVVFVTRNPHLNLFQLNKRLPLLLDWLYKFIVRTIQGRASTIACQDNCSWKLQTLVRLLRVNYTAEYAARVNFIQVFCKEIYHDSVQSEVAVCLSE